MSIENYFAMCMIKDQNLKKIQDRKVVSIQSLKLQKLSTSVKTLRLRQWLVFGTNKQEVKYVNFFDRVFMHRLVKEESSDNITSENIRIAVNIAAKT